MTNLTQKVDAEGTLHASGILRDANTVVGEFEMSVTADRRLRFEMTTPEPPDGGFIDFQAWMKRGDI